MLIVDEAPGEPTVVDLPGGATLTLRPWASGAVAAGQMAAQQALVDGAEGSDANVAFTAGAVRWAALAWSGVGDAKGKPLAMSKARVEQMVIQDANVFREVDRLYVLPGLASDAEKNGSALSLAGAGPAGARKKSSGRPGVVATSAPRAKRPAKRAPPG